MEQLWSACHPKTDEEMIECATLGKSLSKLSQPTILTILAANNKPMHGYIIVQQAAHSPMFSGKKPDATGVYRALKRMEEAELVTSWWETPREGSAKRMFELTDKGRQCLRRWIDALACYKMTIEDLRRYASTALGIDVPDTPYCVHVNEDGTMGEKWIGETETAAEEAVVENEVEAVSEPQAEPAASQPQVEPAVSQPQVEPVASQPAAEDGGSNAFPFRTW